MERTLVTVVVIGLLILALSVLGSVVGDVVTVLMAPLAGLPR